jgi:hypothetical protein
MDRCTMRISLACAQTLLLLDDPYRPSETHYRAHAGRHDSHCQKWYVDRCIAEANKQGKIDRNSKNELAPCFARRYMKVGTQDHTRRPVGCGQSVVKATFRLRFARDFDNFKSADMR